VLAAADSIAIWVSASGCARRKLTASGIWPEETRPAHEQE